MLEKSYTVKRLIIGEDLFGEIGEFKKFAKISRRQIKTSQSENRQINSIIAPKYSRFTAERNNHHDHISDKM